MAAGPTYTPLQSKILGTAVSTVTFSSIAATYTDLIIVMSATSATLDVINMQFNNDSTSGLYSNTRLVGAGNNDRTTGLNFMYVGLVSPARNSDIYHIQNYANTSVFKTVIGESSIVDSQNRLTINLWRNTAAINSVTIYHNSSVNFDVGSTFTLYGITAA